MATMSSPNHAEKRVPTRVSGDANTCAADGVTYSMIPLGLSTITMSVACWTSARKRASLATTSSRASLLSATMRERRQATSPVVRPTIAAMRSAVGDAESSMSTMAGAASSATPSSTIRGRIVLLSVVSTRAYRLRTDGCMTAPARRK